jgi:hypothetical protein
MDTKASDHRHRRPSACHRDASKSPQNTDRPLRRVSAHSSRVHRPSARTKYQGSSSLTKGKVISNVRLLCPRRAEDNLEKLCGLVKQFISDDGAEAAEAYKNASRCPPITGQSLAELEIRYMWKNMRLRHDVNFDRELSFRPNFDGAKGKEKKRNAEAYWRALEAELTLYTLFLSGTSRDLIPDESERELLFKGIPRRIPEMFEAIHNIMLGLVPVKDQASVKEQLDVSMIMQQIRQGVCNFVSMAHWMACILKSHCAPIRDRWVDRMVEKIEEGAETSSTAALVEGLRQLFGILEAMKLVRTSTDPFLVRWLI